MSSLRDLPFARLAVIGVLVAALGLTGCGRKGPLDPPPGASLEGVTQPNMPDVMSSSGQPDPTNDAVAGNSGVGPDGQPMVPKGPQKRIFLDGLLN